jgi:S1-C subfamily serine protease
MAKDLGLSSAEGIYIRSITQGGAGDEAGLLPGDIIVGLNNTNVKSVPEFQELVGRMRPGNQLKLSYFRNGKKNEAFVTLRNKSNSTGNISSKSDILLKRLGIELRNLSTDQLKKAPNGGVVVVSIKQFSIISATNMEPGFIITKINDNRVGSVEQAIAVLEKMSGKVVVEGVYEGYEGAYFYTFRI